MKQMEISKWLKGITILVALMGLVSLFVIVPWIANDLRSVNRNIAFLYWPGLIYVWIMGSGCYVALFWFWKVCCEIGKDNSFSKENALYFIYISKTTIVLALYLFFGGVIITLNGWIQFEILLLMGLGVFVFVAVSILAAALSHLIRKAYEMKEENELTI